MMKVTPNYTTIYSDDAIIVLNKRSGLLVAGDRYDSESPRLDLEAEKEFGKIYAVNRIDKEASGIVIYARTPEAQKNLSAQFESKQITKTYFCLVNGHPLWKDLNVNLPILPDSDNRHRSKINKRFGKSAVTDFTLIGNCGPYSWLKATLNIERTNQVRVHLSANQICIVCDPLYSGNQKPVRLSDFKRKWNGDEEEERPLLNRLALHAYSLEITHPVTGERVTFTAPFPKDMDATRNQLAKVFKIDPLA